MAFRKVPKRLPPFDAILDNMKMCHERDTNPFQLKAILTTQYKMHKMWSGQFNWTKCQYTFVKVLNSFLLTISLKLYNYENIEFQWHSVWPVILILKDSLLHVWKLKFAVDGRIFFDGGNIHLCECATVPLNCQLSFLWQGKARQDTS